MERDWVLENKVKTFVQKLRRSKITVLAVSTVFLFLLSSCGEGGAPPPATPLGKTPGAETKKAVPVQVAEKVEKKKVAEKAEPEFSYNPIGKPDPFKPFIQLMPDKRKSAFLTPLQKYDISQLKLVAIITLPEGSVALVEDQQGKGYFLKRGTAIGRRDGKVKAIHKDRVIVEEAYSDIYGQAKVNEISLYLHRPAGEGGET